MYETVWVTILGQKFIYVISWEWRPALFYVLFSRFLCHQLLLIIIISFVFASWGVRFNFFIWLFFTNQIIFKLDLKSRRDGYGHVGVNYVLSFVIFDCWYVCCWQDICWYLKWLLFWFASNFEIESIIYQSPCRTTICGILDFALCDPWTAKSVSFFEIKIDFGFFYFSY